LDEAAMAMLGIAGFAAALTPGRRVPAAVLCWVASRFTARLTLVMLPACDD
jgi:hypothetical protein